MIYREHSHLQPPVNVKIHVGDHAHDEYHQYIYYAWFSIPRPQKTEKTADILEARFTLLLTLELLMYQGVICEPPAAGTDGQASLEPPNISLTHYNSFRTVQSDWWRHHAPREEGLCTSALSCNKCTGFLYNSEFSTNLFTTIHACMHGAGPSYLSVMLQYHVRDRRLRQPSAVHLTQSITPDGNSERTGFGVGRAPTLEQSPTLSIRETCYLSDFKAA